MDQSLQGPTGGASVDWRGLCEELADALACHYPGHVDDDELVNRVRAALAEPEPEVVGPTLQLPEQAPDEHPPSNLDRREVAAWYHGHACGWQAARAALAAEAVVRELTDEELFRITSDCAALYIADDGDYDNCSEVVAAMRGAIAAALARYGHQPAPPPAGADGELVAWLAGLAVRAADCRQPKAAGMLTWAAQVVGEHADPVDRQAAPVPVAERLPGPEDCDAEGRCWVHQPHEACPESPAWELMLAKYASPNYEAVCWLPAHALPLPAGEGEK